MEQSKTERSTDTAVHIVIMGKNDISKQEVTMEKHRKRLELLFCQIGDSQFQSLLSLKDKHSFEAE